MAVPAASFVVATVSFVVSAAVAAALTTVVSVMPTALTAACQHLDQMLYLFFRCQTVLLNLADEVQFLASQRVVRVDRDAVVLNPHDLRHKLMVFGIVHRDDGPLEDMLVVELAVDAEDITLQLVHTLRDIFPESLVGLQGEVKRFALLQTDEVLLKGVEGDAVSGDELKGTVCARLLFQRLFSVSHSVQLVCN